MDLSKAYSLAEDEYQRRIRRGELLPGDIVYGREGERWGHAALVPEAPVCCLGQRMMQFRASKDFCPAFLMWALNSEHVYRQGQLDTVGATSPHVNVETIRNYVLAQPSMPEQEAIARVITQTCEKFDELIAEAEATTSLLAERRAALISAAVTGKIDVRGLVPQPEAVAA